MGAPGETTKDYAAGVAAGIATVLTGHPFDTIKVKLQTQNTAAQIQHFRGALHCASHILRTEGLQGLYKGATSSFIGVALESSLLFGAYTQAKTALQGGSRAPPSLSTTIAAATMAGASVSVILCPTELVKCRLQVQAGPVSGMLANSGAYIGPWDCVMKTVQRDGASGLFRGLRATFMREAIGNSFFFVTYETSRYYLLQALGLGSDRKRVGGSGKAQPNRDGGPEKTRQAMQEALLEAGTGVISGGLAGMAFWTAVLPFDVVKTRIQTSPDSVANERVFFHMVKLYRQSGIAGLYAGLGPTLARAFPANAAAIVTWELAARFLGVGPEV